MILVNGLHILTTIYVYVLADATEGAEILDETDSVAEYEVIEKTNPYSDYETINEK